MAEHRNEPDRLILIVEDEVFIAMELRDVLRQAGYQVLGPARTVAEALALLRDSRPDAAVLDVNLRGERVSPVARLLQSMKVPYVLASAYDNFSADEQSVLGSVENLGKPTSDDRLRRSLQLLLNRAI